MDIFALEKAEYTMETALGVRARALFYINGFVH